MLNKIKGQGTATKWITSKIAARNKRAFYKEICADGNLKQLVEDVSKTSTINIHLVSFSSSNDFSEQVLSILSFVKYVGNPACWTIYSDGTHTEQQRRIIETAFVFSKIISIDLGDASIFDHIKPSLLPYKEVLLDYARKHPLGKRLFIYLNYEIVLPTLFLDSDILFYKRASILDSIIAEEQSGWYLPEQNWGCLDSRYVGSNAPRLYQANGGFILLKKNISTLSEGLEFLKSLNGNYEYFSEQTVMHILLQANHFFPLDPRIFILDSSDQFDLAYLHGRTDLAIRHYTGPVRHKMWQRDWKWHLSLA